MNLTGSPDYPARVRILSGQDLGGGCNGSDPYRQFNTAAFAGPLPGSNGLESGSNYLRGCFLHTLDLAIARNIRLGGTRAFQIRLDIFNAPNSSIITGRNVTMQLSNPTDPTTITNLPFDAVRGADSRIVRDRRMPVLVSPTATRLRAPCSCNCASRSNRDEGRCPEFRGSRPSRFLTI